MSEYLFPNLGMKKEEIVHQRNLERLVGGVMRRRVSPFLLAASREIRIQVARNQEWEWGLNLISLTAEMVEGVSKEQDLA